MSPKSYLLILCTFFSISVSFSQESDNEELIELHRTDQADRSDNIDWSIVSVNDSVRKARILQMLDSNLVITSNDHANAAMILQHGGDSIAYKMVVDLMTKAIELDPTRSKWLLAAGIDRELMSRKQPQIYGTQYSKYKQEGDEWGPWVLYEIDTTVITDEERIEYGVPTLAQQRARTISMNLPSIENLQEEGMNSKEIVKFCKKESKKDEPSPYLSENSLNNFGYFLMGDRKGKSMGKDALKIFKLNTKLYPESSNPFDSLGECYINLGKIKKGIKAYKRAFELNPNNLVARDTIEEYQK